MILTIQQTAVQKFKQKEALIGVVGLGYVGLPLMLRYNAVGFRVLGIDIDETKVSKLNAGESYIEHIASEKIAAAGKSGFQAMMPSPVSTSALSQAKVISWPPRARTSCRLDLSFSSRFGKHPGAC